MSFCQTRNRSTQSSNVDRRVAGMLRPPGSEFFRRILSARGTARSKLSHSSTAKTGRPLFQEGANALPAVLRVKALELMLNFPFQRLDQGFLLASEDRLFHRANRHLWAGRNFCGHALHLARKTI